MKPDADDALEKGQDMGQMDEIDREWEEWADWDLDVPDDDVNPDDEEELEGGAGVLSPLDPDDPRNEGGASVKLDRELALV